MIFLTNKLSIVLYNKSLFFINCFGFSVMFLFSFKNYLKIFFKINLMNFFYLENHSFDLFFNYLIHKYCALKKIKSIAKDLNKIYIKKINLLGIGFKSWIFSNKQKVDFLILKIGFSFDICYFVFSGVKCICLKSTLVLFKAMNKQILHSIVNSICRIKKWKLYKNNGIFLFDKVLHLKTIKNK